MTSSSRSDSVSRASFDENVSFIIIVFVGVVTSCGLVQILTLCIVYICHKSGRNNGSVYLKKGLICCMF